MSRDVDDYNELKRGSWKHRIWRKKRFKSYPRPPKKDRARERRQYKAKQDEKQGRLEDYDYDQSES